MRGGRFFIFAAIASLIGGFFGRRRMRRGRMMRGRGMRRW